MSKWFIAHYTPFPSLVFWTIGNLITHLYFRYKSNVGYDWSSFASLKYL